jgi:PUA-domain protein
MADLRLRHRARMRTKDVKRLNDAVKSALGLEEDPFPEDAERAEAAPHLDVIIIRGQALGLVFKDTESERAWLTVRGLIALKPTKGYVTVDMGAVRFVTNGADIMAPGIVDADPGLTPGALVWVRDEKNGQPLGVGEALVTGAEMKESSKGKAVKSLHHVGDELWNLEV